MKATRGRRAGCGRRATRRQPSAPSTRRSHSASAALGKAPVAAPVVVSFAATVNPAGVAQPACTRCGDCCGGCNVGAKNTVALTYLPDAVRHGAEIFTHAKVRHVAKAPRGRLARPLRAAGRRRRWRRQVRHGDGGHGRAGGRHAGLDRDPAALARAGARPVRPAGQELLGQRRHHRLRLRRQAAGQCHRRRASAQGRWPRRRRLRLRPDRDRRRAGPRQQPDHPGGRAALGAGADPAGAVHPQRPPAGRAQEPHRRRLQGAVREPADVLCRVARHGLGAPRAGGRPDRARLARRQGRAGLPPPRRGAGGAGAASRRQLRQEPARRHHDGPAAGDRASARRLRHGDASAATASSTTNARCSMPAPAPARPTCTMGST